MSQPPKYSKIMETVRRRVESGVYGPARMLPSERTLARELGANHETVNKAIAHLVAEGLLYRKGGIGTFICPPDVCRSAGPRTAVVDILLYRRGIQLFRAASFHEEIVFSLQDRLGSVGLGCNIVPVLDVEDFSTHVRDADGFVITGFLPKQHLDIIEDAGRPIVALDFSPPSPRVTPVVVEHRAIGYLCRHLVELGHRRIAFVKGPGFDAAEELRLLAFRSYMETGGLPENLPRVFSMSPDDPSDTERLVRTLEGCTAVMAADDFLAVKIRNILHRAGVHVPRDVSLTGYGNLSIMHSLYPTLTTADVDRDALCDAVVGEMEAWLAGRGSTETRGFASAPVMRASTAPPRA